MTYAMGLARYLATRGISVEFLSTGHARIDGLLVATPVMEADSGELAFVRRLSCYLRKRKFPDNTVVVANTEWYAWAFRNVRPRLRLVLVAHGPSFPTLRIRKPIVATLFNAFIEPQGVRVARSIIAVDSESQAYFSEKYPNANIRRVPIGIDTGHFKPVSRENARSRWRVRGRPALLFVGRLAPEKRPELAAAAFRAVRDSRPEASLIVAGTGPGSKAFDEASAEFGSERVRLLGFVPRADLPSLYSAADALLLTSAIEQFPTVILESLACGTQVFSTNAGDSAVILNDPALGVICESSAESLAEAILSRTPEDEIVRMSHETLRREAAERYSWERVGPEIVGVLEATEAESGSGNR